MVSTEKLKAAGLRHAEELTRDDQIKQERLKELLASLQTEYDKLLQTDEVGAVLQDPKALDSVAGLQSQIEALQRKLDIVEEAIEQLGQRILENKRQALEPIQHIDSWVGQIIQLKKQTATELIMTDGAPSHKETALKNAVNSFTARIKKIGETYKCNKAADELIKEISAPISGITFNFGE